MEKHIKLCIEYNVYYVRLHVKLEFILSWHFYVFDNKNIFKNPRI